MKSCENCIHVEVCAICAPPLPICDSYKDIDSVYLTKEEYEELLEYKYMYEDLCE
ncbi:MAG: hypothetical protein J6R59_10210 [Paludibacteraceae bacterium]|nr:hypothetical protein [Paludibacteraceae bacterium]